MAVLRAFRWAARVPRRSWHAEACRPSYRAAGVDRSDDAVDVVGVVVADIVDDVFVAVAVAAVAAAAAAAAAAAVVGVAVVAVDQAVDSAGVVVAIDTGAGAAGAGPDGAVPERSTIPLVVA